MQTVSVKIVISSIQFPYFWHLGNHLLQNIVRKHDQNASLIFRETS
jgi:hypothetical protein